MTIYGPKGIKSFILTSLRVSGTVLKYSLKIHEIAEEGIVFKDEQFKVTCLQLEHGIQSFGYRIEEADHQGMLQVERLKALGVPSGPLYGKLKNEEVITLEDGRVLDGSDYVGAPQKGRVVAILGDTKKSSKSEILARDADVLIHESTFEGSEQKLARAYNHSTNIEAAEVARAANVNCLLLTHISARYLLKEAYQLETEAKKVFSHTRVVKDFEEVVIPQHRNDKK